MKLGRWKAGGAGSITTRAVSRRHQSKRLLKKPVDCLADLEQIVCGKSDVLIELAFCWEA